MVQRELDSFYVKFKNLLRSEKDATLTLKAEAGKASVTLSVDLGHVLSEHDQLQPRGPRNGPARHRRREKRAAARAEAEKASAEGVKAKDFKIDEKAEQVFDANGSATEEVAALNSAAKAKEQDDKPTEKVVEPVEELKDEVCPDEIYRCKHESKLVSIGIQTLECGTQSSTRNLEFYTLTYEDYDDPD